MASDLKLDIIVRAFDKASEVFKRVGEAGQHLTKALDAAKISAAGGALIRAGIGAFGLAGGIAYAGKKALDMSGDVQAAMLHLSTALDAGAAGQREYAQAQKFVEEMSIRFNVAQEDVANNLYRSMSFLGDWNQALKTTQVSLAVAKGNMGDAAVVGQQLAIIVHDFSDKTKAVNPQIQRFGDELAYISRHGAFANVGELNAGIGVSIGAAKAAGMTFEDYIATLNAYSQAGLTGSESGSALNETLAAFAKGKLQTELGVALAKTKQGGIDVIGTLINLRKAVGNGTISINEFQRAAKALGIRGERALAVDVTGLERTREAVHSTAVSGAAIQGANTMLSAYVEQVGILGKKWEQIVEIFGNALMPDVKNLVKYFSDLADRLHTYLDQNPQVLKQAVYWFEMGLKILGVFGALGLASGGILKLVSYGIRIATVTKGVFNFGIAVAETAVKIASAVNWTKLWEAAQWALNVALDANPIGAVILGITLLAGAAYEVYEHWTAIKNFFLSLGTWFKDKLWPMMKQLGEDLVRLLGEGLLSGLHYLAHPVATVAGLIRDHFKGHSPPPLGPLHELNRLRIVETIAETLKPAPLYGPVRNLAATTALVAPLLLAPALSPGRGFYGDQLRHLADRRPSIGSVVINYQPKIEIKGGGETTADFKAAVSLHGDEILRVIKSKLAREARLQFDRE